MKQVANCDINRFDRIRDTKWYRNYREPGHRKLYLIDRHGNYLHRVLCDCPPGYEVDHISLDTGGGSNTVQPSEPPSDDYIVDSNFVETYTITKADKDWKHVFKNLDRYDYDENPYYYYVVETECVPESYHIASYGNDNLTDTGTITVTNSRKLMNFDILKVDSVTADHLADASFVIQQVKETSSTTTPEYAEGSTRSNPETTGSDGIATFTGIAPGYYEVLETETPDGYIIAGDAAFYIKITGSSIKLLKKVVGENSVTFEEASPGEKVGNVTLSTDGTTITFTVENEPGAALPSTGGRGTTWIYLLGSLLVIGCGILLIARRRIRPAFASDPADE